MSYSEKKTSQLQNIGFLNYGQWHVLLVIFVVVVKFLEHQYHPYIMNRQEILKNSINVLSLTIQRSLKEEIHDNSQFSIMWVRAHETKDPERHNLSWFMMHDIAKIRCTVFFVCFVSFCCIFGWRFIFWLFLFKLLFNCI